MSFTTKCLKALAMPILEEVKSPSETPEPILLAFTDDSAMTEISVQNPDENSETVFSCLDNISPDEDEFVVQVVSTSNSEDAESVIPAEDCLSEVCFSDNDSESAEPIVPVSCQYSDDTQSKPVSIESYFKSKGIDIDLSCCKSAAAPVESLAFTIAINYAQTKQFIRYIRESITKKNFDFAFSLSPLSCSERSSVVSLADKLNDYGILSNVYYNKTISTLYGTISSAPKVINFINGNFMEIYAKCVTVGVAKKLAEKYDCDYEVYSNVSITKGNEKHELDLLFRIGSHVFWSEVKSGKFDPDTYRKLGVLIGMVPDRLIFLAAERDNNMCECISYFYEYYAANISTFKNTLIEMTEKAFREENQQ